MKSFFDPPKKRAKGFFINRKYIIQGVLLTVPILNFNNEQKYRSGYIYSVTFLIYKYERFIISIGSLLFL